MIKPILTILLVVFSSSLMAQDLKAIWNKDCDCYGYKDSKGNLVIPYKYSFALDFSEGMGAVSANGKSGFINKDDKAVIPFMYEWAEAFGEGLAAVQLDGKWGFINKNGKQVIPFTYEEAKVFHEGLVKVRLNKKWGFINHVGKVIVPPVYDRVDDFSEGMASVAPVWGAGYGYINKDGKMVIPVQYKFVYSFSDGVAMVSTDKGYYHIDKTGKVLDPLDSKNAPIPAGKTGAAVVQNSVAAQEPGIKTDNLWGRSQEVKKAAANDVVLVERKKPAQHSKYFEKGLKAWKDIDFKKSHPQFLKAAAEGDADAWYYIGWQWLDNYHDVVARVDIDTAKYYFQKGIDAGSGLAMYGMGEAYYKQANAANDIYHSGARLIKVYDSLSNIKLAYYKMAANAGCGRAMNVFFNAESPYKVALYCATKSAEAGDARGMIHMGMLYQYGWGLPVDKAAAKKWYTLALDNWLLYDDRDLALLQLKRIDDTQPRRITLQDYGFPDADYKEQRLEKQEARDYTAENAAYNEWWEKTYGRGGTQNSRPMPNNNIPQAGYRPAAQSEADRHQSIMNKIYRETEKQMNRSFKNY
ncbi:SEL1-like repeat protein [Pedobacter frigoris]|uniref:SEL1-like repeat protein n=1 Tax=Pedobacter frigoris TaxID=2571272 RepID=UPI00292EFBF7|nr:SEL1-like repeat protein [Pedobacter frigoris]